MKKGRRAATLEIESRADISSARSQEEGRGVEFVVRKYVLRMIGR
jgi:hypothetical protein